ncbi:unnamed protein product [Brassica oleracea var. botrytis]|uniref:Uncharacterized protein n=1 Tax=Brassica oleracea var. oleracea TaxID=109376 RepID=A0A0D3DSF4_BRAOL|nr:PREDICTED: uncharacterized protein LOC106310555 [Brassica oleracea var. oleracea]
MQHHSEVTTSTDQPICPKPRRVCPSLPDFLKPLSCPLHSSNCQQSSEGRSGVLSIIDKVQPIEGGTVESMWYAGSPPRRTGNPLVHDRHFIHCLDLFPSFSSTKA